jgi:hypothetical protein
MRATIPVFAVFSAITLLASAEAPTESDSILNFPSGPDFAVLRQSA